MEKEYSIHWLEEAKKKIIERNAGQITLSTGKTPSGHIHLGILREILICDALKRLLENDKNIVRAYLFLDDFDAAKRFPAYIDKRFQKDHLGKPFALIPCPFKECECESYAHHFGTELISTFKEFGIENEIIWSYQLYKKKEMQNKIKISLEKVEQIKEILKKYILPTLDEQKKKEFLNLQKTWLPVMVLCEKCGKLQTINSDGSIIPNRAISYNIDREEVFYRCVSCGNSGSISIYSGNLKLNWRIDWPAKWSLFKTTFEPAGKDHAVKGGAYDTGIEICQKIFNYDGPIKLPYEWLRLGDYDMKTSKGIVFTPKKYLEMAHPEIFRMLILRTNPMKHISLRIEELPQYYDAYEKLENIFFNQEKLASEKEIEFSKYLYPLTRIDNVPEKKPIRIPFKLLIFLAQIQNILNIEKLYKKAREAMGNPKTFISMEDFRNQLNKVENWLEELQIILSESKDIHKKNEILRKISIFSVPEKLNGKILEKLSEEQQKGLLIFKEFLLSKENLEPDEIQNKIFKIAKEDLNISPRKLFEAIYLIILGKKSGPRLGPFLSLLERDWLINRFNLIK